MNSEFLDSKQYTPEGIRAYEKVWGGGFISPGGAEMARELITSMKLPPDSLVLDACCGAGGSAFLMAREFGLKVEGLDLSHNMINRGRELLARTGLKDRVVLRQGDCLELDVEDRYDAVYSRDAFLHIEAKERLFENLFRSLKRGGRLLLTDYASSSPPWGREFQDYVDEHGYHLHTPGEYEAIVRRAGFAEARATDWTDRFIVTLEEELENLRDLGESELIAGWEAKLRRALGKEQRWVLVTARKPRE